MKFAILTLIIVLGISCLAQKKNEKYIYYNLPEAVTSKINQYIDTCVSYNENLYFAAKIIDLSGKVFESSGKNDELPMNDDEIAWKDDDIPVNLYRIEIRTYTLEDSLKKK